MNRDELRQRVAARYRPGDPDLFTFTDAWLDPRFVAAGRDPSRLEALWTEHPGDAVSFPLLAPATCARLLAEVDAYDRWCVAEGLPTGGPNSMNNYGAVLDDFGLYPALQALIARVVAPLAPRLFPEVAPYLLDDHHGFVVAYAEGGDVALGFHVDASLVTLNVCLGRDFEGGELYFAGVRCPVCQQTPPRPEEQFELAHEPGVAILHRGPHRHGAHPIRAGERRNLILWCRSSSHDGWRHCDRWCGGHAG